jgi:hypothetical protein
MGLASLAGAALPQQYRVVDTNELPAYWIAQPGHEQRPPHYAADAVRGGIESCIEVGFSIAAEGVQGNFTVLRSVVSDGAARDLAEALKIQATDAVAATRYAPAASNPQRLEVYCSRSVWQNRGMNRRPSARRTPGTSANPAGSIISTNTLTVRSSPAGEARQGRELSAPESVATGQPTEPKS